MTTQTILSNNSDGNNKHSNLKTFLTLEHYTSTPHPFLPGFTGAAGLGRMSDEQELKAAGGKMPFSLSQAGETWRANLSESRCCRKCYLAAE